MSIEEKRRVAEERRIAKEKAERLKSLKKLKKNIDDVSGMTWYKQPYFTHYTNTFLTSIYMGERSEEDTGYYNVWLRLKMSYKGSDWIFFERAYLSYDGNTKEIKFDDYDDKESDNSGYGVWEWIDVRVDDDTREFLREFAKSKNAKMRFTGKYTKTRKLTYNERRGILDILNGYDALKNKK